MAKPYDYDLIVIGAGIAGFVSAVTANGLGKRVAIIEKGAVGGNCTNFTCIPSKTLIRLSHVGREMAHLDRFGFPTVPLSDLGTGNVMAHIRSVVKKAHEKDRAETFERIGISVISGTASFVDRHHVEVSGRTLSARKFIIAAGTRPMVPRISGLHDIDYLTSENLYELDELPGSLIILGGGVDGLEYASAFGRLGVETTVVEMATRLLPTADREAVNLLLRTLQAEGIRVLTGAKAVSMTEQHNKVTLTFEQTGGKFGEIHADRVLVAVGRKPDLDELSLENAGVKQTPRGIITNSKLRTSARNIYACGDVVGPYQLASTAEYHGVIAATNAFLPVKRSVDYRNNVYVIFTDPPLAYLGLTEEEANETYGDQVAVYRFDYANMRRAMVDGTEVGMAKILVNGRGRIVGAHILGEAAAEVIHEVLLIKALNQPLHKVHFVTHAYPTYAQALVGRASQLAYLDRMGTNSLVGKVLDLLPGYANRLHVARERLAETPTSDHLRPVKLTVAVEAEAAHPGELHVKAVCIGDTACVIDLPVEVMGYDEGPILAASPGSGTRAPQYLILNFAHVRRINGLGASMLVKLSARTRRTGQRLIGYGVDGGLRDILKVTELDQAIRIYDSETGALLAAGLSPEQTPVESVPETRARVDVRHWAKPVEHLELPPMPDEARKLNVNGRGVVSPVNGFGQLWQKLYTLRIRDSSITPEDAIAAVKENFPSFQPHFNRFFASEAGIRPGEIVLIDSSTPGGPLSTGVMVVYADERSFTFITPQGHPESGLVSFAAHEMDGEIVVQVVGVARSNDPLYEGAYRLVGTKVQVRIWTHLLRSLAAHLGVPADITVEQTCVDTRMQWSQMRNVWHNAQIRTLMFEPVRWLRALMGRYGKRPDGA